MLSQLSASCERNEGIMFGFFSRMICCCWAHHVVMLFRLPVGVKTWMKIMGNSSSSQMCISILFMARWMYIIKVITLYSAGGDCSDADSPPFSKYEWESSKDLIISVIANAARTRPKPDFILCTGDMTRHRTNILGSKERAQESVNSALTSVLELLRQYFPNVTLLSFPAIDLGNNDFESDYVLTLHPNTRAAWQQLQHQQHLMMSLQ